MRSAEWQMQCKKDHGESVHSEVCPPAQLTLPSERERKSANGTTASRLAAAADAGGAAPPSVAPAPLLLATLLTNAATSSRVRGCCAANVSAHSRCAFAMAVM